MHLTYLSYVIICVDIYKTDICLHSNNATSQLPKKKKETEEKNIIKNISHLHSIQTRPQGFGLPVCFGFQWELDNMSVCTAISSVSSHSPWNLS